MNDVQNVELIEMQYKTIVDKINEVKEKLNNSSECRAMRIKLRLQKKLLDKEKAEHEKKAAVVGRVKSRFCNRNLPKP